ncbi:MAG: SGNH/GDSL hydrolase family protein, partial [Rhodothermales bacterium]
MQTKWSTTIVFFLMILWLGPLHASHGQHASPDGGFELENGDRVVFLGGTFIEAAQEHGYIELAFTTRWPVRNVTFRNVGWAGDTVFGDARRHFTSPPGPYERLLDEVAAPDPTVLIVGYGSDVPFGGDGALSRFEEGLNRLLDDLESETGARVILLSPPPHDADTSPVPADVVRATNESLRRVSEVIAGVARVRGHWFVDVFSGLQQLERETSTSIFSDGIHLNAAGYYLVAYLIEEALGLPSRGWAATLNLATGRHAAEAARITNV